MNAGVDGGRQRLDGPGRVHRVDPDVQRVQFLQREHVVPCRAQLEQTLSGIFIHLQTKDMAWSTTNTSAHFSITAELALLQVYIEILYLH